MNLGRRLLYNFSCMLTAECVKSLLGSSLHPLFISNYLPLPYSLVFLPTFLSQPQNSPPLVQLECLGGGPGAKRF